MSHHYLRAAFTLLRHPRYAQESSRKHVGKIIWVDGEAYLEEEGGNRRLTARERGSLFAEQKLRCATKCRIDFSIGSTTER